MWSRCSLLIELPHLYDDVLQSRADFPGENQHRWQNAAAPRLKTSAVVISRHCSPPTSPNDRTSRSSLTMSDQAICTKEHVFFCFDVLEAHLKGDKPGDAPFENANESLSVAQYRIRLIVSALFVTWKKSSGRKDDGQYDLRGCIGNFSPMVLEKGLAEYAITRYAHAVAKLRSVQSTTAASDRSPGKNSPRWRAGNGPLLSLLITVYPC